MGPVSFSWSFEDASLPGATASSGARDSNRPPGGQKDSRYKRDLFEKRIHGKQSFFKNRFQETIFVCWSRSSGRLERTRSLLGSFQRQNHRALGVSNRLDQTRERVDGALLMPAAEGSRRNKHL